MIKNVRMSVLSLELIFGDVENWLQSHEIVKQIPDRHLLRTHSRLRFNEIVEVCGVKYG